LEILLRRLIRNALSERTSVRLRCLPSFSHPSALRLRQIALGSADGRQDGARMEAQSQSIGALQCAGSARADVVRLLPSTLLPCVRGRDEICFVSLKNNTFLNYVCIFSIKS
jgi:hypothetical protein